MSSQFSNTSSHSLQTFQLVHWLYFKKHNIKKNTNVVFYTYMEGHGGTCLVYKIGKLVYKIGKLMYICADSTPSLEQPVFKVRDPGDSPAKRQHFFFFVASWKVSRRTICGRHLSLQSDFRLRVPDIASCGMHAFVRVRKRCLAENFSQQKCSAFFANNSCSPRFLFRRILSFPVVYEIRGVCYYF